MGHVTHRNESCHTYEWILSHMWNESCHTYDKIMTHVWNESCHMYDRVMTHMWNESCHTYARVMTHVWSEVTSYTEANASIAKCVTSRINEARHMWIGHVAYEWVMSHMIRLCQIRIRYVIRQSECKQCQMCHVTYEWCTLPINESHHIWSGHVAHDCVLPNTNTSRHTYEWVMSRI